MQHILSRLTAILSKEGSNLDEVRQLLAELEAQIPDPVARLKAIREGLLASQGQPMNTSPPASGFSLDWKYILGLLGAAAVGGGGTASFLDPSILQRIQFSIPVPNTPILLAIAAGIGAVVGFGYSIYYNGWKLVLPTFSRDRGANTLAVDNFGFLDETFSATVFTVLAVWLKFPGDGAPVLNQSTVLLAVTAAVVGARMRAGIWDRDLLRKALTEVVTTPAATPALAEVVRSAPTAAAAAAAATGKAVPGFGPPKLPEGVMPPAETELLQWFNVAKLKDRLAARGRPIGPDGDGLTLETLDQFQPLVPNLKPFIKDMRVAEIAAMSDNEFLAAVARNGIDVDSARPALTAVHAAARGVMEKLRSLPSGWELRADRLP